MAYGICNSLTSPAYRVIESTTRNGALFASESKNASYLMAIGAGCRPRSAMAGGLWTFLLAAMVLSSLAYAGAPRAYIVSDRRITPVDVATDSAAGPSISLPESDATTGYVALSPDGRFVYVGIGHYVPGTPGGYNDGAVAVIDTQQGVIVKTFSVNGDPRGLAITPDGGTLYAYKGYDLGLGTTAISVIALPPGTITTTVPVPKANGKIAASPDGHSVVALTTSGLSFIDTRINAVTATMDLPGQPFEVTFSPDGTILYVLTMDTAGSLLRISSKSHVITGSIPVGDGPAALAVNAGGSRIYLTDGVSRSMLVVNADLWQVVTQVPVGAYPTGIAVAPSGDKIYVALQSSGVTVVSAANNQVTNFIEGLGWVKNYGSHFIGPRVTAIPYAVEYFHDRFGHYFMTSSATEIDKLDAGDFAGWSRTGQRFDVYLSQTAGTAAVCRFFTTAFGPKSSHFYALRGLGCESTFENRDWQYEGDVYFMRLPDASGSCPLATVPVYRMYNDGQGGAPNHRFSTSLEVRAQMLTLGWIPEGAGLGVSMCSTAP